MEGENVDDFVVRAFVEDLSMFCGVATGAFRSLRIGVMFSVSGDSGGELGLEVTKLVRGGPVVFGGSSSSFVFIGLVTVPFDWNNFESAVSSTGGFTDLNKDILLP